MFGFLLKWLLIATSFLNMSINDLDNLIKRMQLYQKWRRGDTDEWNSDPTLLGKEVTFLYMGLTGLGTPNFARVDPDNCFKNDR